MAKSSGNWLNSTPISNRFSSLQQEDDLVNQSSPGKEAIPKPPPIYITNVIAIPPLYQLLDQIVPQLYEAKALAQNQVKTNIKLLTFTALSQKLFWIEICTFMHTNLKKNVHIELCLKMHYSINPEDIKNEIARLGHKVSNIWNVKHFLTKQPLSMFFIDLLPATNNKNIYNVEFLQQSKILFEPPRHSRTKCHSMCQLSALWAY
jgi:hypothetical protein